MVHSMTAFARVERPGPQGTLSWELRSVNHRYLEPHLRLPETFRDLESGVREALRRRLSRGKVECVLREARDESAALRVDARRAAQLVAAAEDVAALIARPAKLDPLAVLAWPGVLAGAEVDGAELKAQTLALFEAALDELLDGRQREGRELARLIEERLDQVLAEVATLRALLPELLALQRRRILERCAEAGVEFEPARLEQELVLLAQKSDVAEELDRLETHVAEVRRVLAGSGAAGRRLDFLMQELNREANTLGSKAIDARASQAAINLKVLIEQMREQVQNIE